MAEPTSSTVAAIAATTGTIVLTGSLFGLQYDAMLMGLFGGLIALMHLPIPPAETKWGEVLHTAMSLFSAAVLAGLFSPVAAPALAAGFEFLSKIPPTTLRLAAAGAIGLLAQVGIPVLFALVRRKGDSA